MPLNKKQLSERDICTKYITPALEAAGWNRHTQFLEEVSFTDGKIYVRGKLAARGQGKRADYILYYKPNIPIAIIEAKDNHHSMRAGIQQALDYARILDIPCVFSSNGDGFLFHDRSAFVTAEGSLQRHKGGAKGSPAVSRFVIAEGNLCVTYDSTHDAAVVFDDDKKSGKNRYHQIAVNRTVRISIRVDLEGWRPEKDKTDKDGNLVEDRIYNTRDYDRKLVIEERTDVVAQKVTEFLKGLDRYAKTIVFCQDIDHAERMRSALTRWNADLVALNYKYVMQITGDNDEGKRELENFTNPEERYPVIAATSELMTTGVDAQTCQVIVLDANINSMTKFKQIIGRGTRNLKIEHQNLINH